MKPYALIIYNKIKLSFISLLHCPGFKARGIQMLGNNTKLKFNRSSKVSFEERIVSDGRCVMIVDTQGTLSIGSKVYFNEGTMISCKSKVSIGKGCLFGPNVKIFDNDHCFDRIDGVSTKHKTGNITIGENCWIGANVVLLRNTEIGENCVIAAGCVVKGIIPDCSIVTQSRELKIRPIAERD